MFTISQFKKTIVLSAFKIGRCGARTATNVAPECATQYRRKCVNLFCELIKKFEMSQKNVRG